MSPRTAAGTEFLKIRTDWAKVLDFAVAGGRKYCRFRYRPATPSVAQSSGRLAGAALLFGYCRRSGKKNSATVYQRSHRG
jgi:hypothetical protein